VGRGGHSIADHDCAPAPADRHVLDVGIYHRRRYGMLTRFAAGCASSQPRRQGTRRSSRYGSGKLKGERLSLLIWGRLYGACPFFRVALEYGPRAANREGSHVRGFSTTNQGITQLEGRMKAIRRRPRRGRLSVPTCTSRLHILR